METHFSHPGIEARRINFKLDLPVYYVKDEWLVAEYKDGTITKLRHVGNNWVSIEKRKIKL